MPNDDVGEGVFGNIDSAADQFLRFHSDHDGYARYVVDLSDA